MMRLLVNSVLAAKVVTATLFLQTATAPGASKEELSSTCGRCHIAQTQSQPRTSMAHALQLPSDDALFKTHSRLTFRESPYSFTVERQGDQILYSVTNGSETISLPIRYVFGVGAQTFVLERDGQLYESYVSYYPSIDGLDITMGDQQIHPTTVAQAMGRLLPSDQSTACFGCHASGAVVGGQLKLASLTPGLTCEHCHSGTREHFQAISNGTIQAIPPKLGRISPEELSDFCGQCHRTWETVVRNRWRGEVNARFQPYRLANSKCFDGVDRRMSCIACHDPHQEISREKKAYDAKCLACHSSGAKPSAGMIASHPKQPANKTAMRMCPVSQSDCVGCHMPKVQLPGSHMSFTDHDIRIYHAGDPYPN